MQKNHIVWGAIESLVDAYKTIDDEGNIVLDVESQIVVRRTLVARLEFFYRNKLLTINPFGDKGALIDRPYSRSDFTDEGYDLCRKIVPAWLKSKASSKLPPDMKMLERGLAEIRAEIK